MRKGLIGYVFCLAIVSCSLVISQLGCGQQSSETTTTTTTTIAGMSQSVLNQSKAGALFASSGTGIAVVAEDAASLSATASSLGIPKVNAFGLPDSFYSAPDANGYSTVEGFYSSESVKVRYKTAGGTIVAPSWLSARSIATFEGYNWNSEFSSPRVLVNTVQVTAWAANPTYKTLSTFADYIVWSHIANAEEYGYRSSPSMNSLLAGNHWISPTYEAADRVGSMDAVVTISGSSANGIINMDMVLNDNAEQYAAPVSGTGSGTITVEAGSIATTLESSLSVTFGNDGVFETLNMTGTTTDKYKVMISCIADGSGTGTISSESGSLVATMEVSKTVNKVTTVEVWDINGNHSTFNL